MTNEKRNEYAREYYLKNKEKILERNRKWRQENKEANYKAVYRCRKRKAQKLKAEGIKYCWLSEKERETRNEKRRNNQRNKEIEISNISE